MNGFVAFMRMVWTFLTVGGGLAGALPATLGGCECEKNCVVCSAAIASC